MDAAKDPAPVWSAQKNAWVAESVNEGLAAELLKRAEQSKTAQIAKRADDQRPKRKRLSAEAGPWPRVSGAAWVAKKGKVSLKRSGPFGIGSTYSILGTWSAEPKEPVETFWTMPS